MRWRLFFVLIGRNVTACPTASRVLGGNAAMCVVKRGYGFLDSESARGQIVVGHGRRHLWAVGVPNRIGARQRWMSFE
jgi:hypothetical protein